MRAYLAAAIFGALAATGCTQSTSSLSTVIDVSARDTSLRVTAIVMSEDEGDGNDTVVDVGDARFTVAYHAAELELTRGATTSGRASSR